VSNQFSALPDNAKAPSRRGKHVFVLFYDLVHLLILCRETPCRGFGGCSDLLFTFRSNHKDDKYPNLRDHLSALLLRYLRDYISWDCLRYPIEFISQSNNDTTRPRFINNMTLPHIWLCSLLTKHHKLQGGQHHTIPRL
jgi:hypothetical protein